MTYLLTQTLNGLFSAALLFLIASGLTLAFGVMKIVNIAHGSFYMLGVYVAYSVFLRTQSLLWGAVVAIVVVGAIGFVMQRYFLRRFAADPLAQMMMTMGFALLFRDGALMVWGGDPFTLQYPGWLSGSMETGDVVFPLYRLFVIVVAALAVDLAAIESGNLVGGLSSVDPRGVLEEVHQLAGPAAAKGREGNLVEQRPRVAHQSPPDSAGKLSHARGRVTLVPAAWGQFPVTRP